MRKCPSVLVISNWMETRRGQYVTYVSMSITPVTAVTLDLMNLKETGFMALAVGLGFLIVATAAVFLVCGKSLIDTIDVSLMAQRHQSHQGHQPRASKAIRSSKKVTNHEEGTQDGSPRIGNKKGDTTLLTARTKVKRVLILVVSLSVMTECMLLFEIFGGYGFGAPLMLFVGPLVIMTPVWNSINVQLHAGRSKRRQNGSSRQHVLSSTDGGGAKTSRRGLNRLTSMSGCVLSRFSRSQNQHQIVPREAPTIPC